MDTATTDAFNKLLTALISVSAVTALGALMVAYLLYRIERHLTVLNGRLGITELWQDRRDTEAGRGAGT